MDLNEKTTYCLRENRTGRTDDTCRFYFAFEADALYFDFDVHDEEIVSPYTEDNEDLWQGDAVEVFLSPDGNLKRYMELEVSPNGVRFYGEITNEDGKTPQLKKTKPQFDAEAMRTEYGYRVSIRLPFTALEGFDRSKMKLNAFCLDKMFGGQQKLYALNPTRCDSFHRPKFFIGEAEK